MSWLDSDLDSSSDCSELELFSVLKAFSDGDDGIRAGLAADIIATAANPLENIAALHKVNFVMKDGKVVRDSRATVRH